LSLTGCRSIQLYGNYINNGRLEQDILDSRKVRAWDRIVVFGEDDIVRAARLRERLGLPGQSTESAIAYRDKVRMKEWLQQAGVPVPAFARLSSPMDLIEFREAHGLPLFVKPISASGSTAAHSLRSDADFQECLAKRFQARIPFSEYVPDLMVEKFIDGD